MKSRTIQVFEFEKLTIHPDWKDQFLTVKELEKLYEFNDKNHNCYFTGIRDGIRFQNYVGVIQIGGLTIEILPKADKNAKSKEEYQHWHSALLKMLKVCKHIDVSSVSEANLKRKHHSLLDLYFEMYLNEVQNLLRVGLIKQYRKQASNILALKGRLDFNKNIQQNLIHKERFYTEHQVYDYDHLINQILLKALITLDNLTFNPQLKDRIKRLTMSFPEMKIMEIQKHHFEKVKVNRKSTLYAKALQIAQMILLNYSPDIKSGQENMLTLLFDMNKLWEEYIYQMLLKTKRSDISVNFQNRQDFWETRTIRPDLVLKHKVNGESFTYVIDTKWKLLDTINPKPSDDDLKQMYAYNLYWNAKKSMLLYPNSNSIKESFGRYWKGTDSPENNKCKVGFIHVLNAQNQLDLGIGDKILEKILAEN